LVRAAGRYTEQVHPAPRRRREHAVSKLVAAYIACPEVVAEVSHRGGFGRANQPVRVAWETKRLQRLSPEAQSIRVATLIQHTQRLLNQPLTLARVGLSQTCAELAALKGAHPVLHSIARKLCGAAFRRLAGAAQGV
jgi:hypothetical protein